MNKGQNYKPKENMNKDKSKESKKKSKLNALESEGCIMLNYRAGHTSNLIEFEEPLSTYIQKCFGKGAEIFKTGEYFIYPEIEYDPDELSDARDPAHIKRAELHQKVKKHCEENNLKVKDFLEKLLIDNL